MRLAEIKTGFFGFLARVFDSWASFLRPPVEPVREDPFVSAGPPAHWLELTAGLTFTEFGAAPGESQVEPGPETGVELSRPETGENETRASRPREASALLEAEEAFVKNPRPPAPESGKRGAPPEPTAKKTAGARPAFSFSSFGEKGGHAAEDPPAFPQTPERGSERRFPSEVFLKSGAKKKTEHFSGETKFYSPEKNVTGDAGQESRIVPVLSKEPQAETEEPPPQKISGRRPDDASEVFAPREVFAPGEVRAPQKNESVSGPAFVEAGERSQIPGVVVFPGRNNSGTSQEAENFAARTAAERFPEISAIVPAKISAPPGAAAFPEPVRQNKPREFASVFPAPRGGENDFGRGIVGRGEKASDFPEQPETSNASRWADLPELELGGAGGAGEADQLRLKHLAELEREQKGERWSV